jgi:MoaA/NifB/PqqE/SkfB family radical SAM enzyme
VRTAVSINRNSDVNDKIRGKGSYNKALNAMKQLSKNGILDCVVTTMTKYNANDVAHKAKLAAEYGAKMFVYHNPDPVGQAGKTYLTSAHCRRIRRGIQPNM